MQNTTHRVFVLAVQSAVSNAGRDYKRQPIQIIQSPEHFDERTFYFPSTDSDVLEPGHYDCRIYFENSKTGLRLRFENFEKVEA